MAGEQESGSGDGVAVAGTALLVHVPTDGRRPLEAALHERDQPNTTKSHQFAPRQGLKVLGAPTLAALEQRGVRVSDRRITAKRQPRLLDPRCLTNPAFFRSRRVQESEEPEGGEDEAEAGSDDEDYCYYCYYYVHVYCY